MADFETEKYRFWFYQHDTTWEILPIEEIKEQIENVPKWQRLRKAISELKRQL